MKINNDIAMVVASCDAYEDVWNPFFKLLYDNWVNFNYHLYLVCETKRFSFDGLNIKVLNFNDSFWSNRLIKALKNIKSNYILFSLDDFFINKKVNEEEIQFCLCEIKKHKDIASFSFANSLVNDIDDRIYSNYVLRHLYGEYRFNTQAALWRKKDLLKILRKSESAWEAENNGTFRARVLLPNKRFYALKPGISSAISYEFGGGLHHGMWTTQSIKLFKIHNIEGIDFAKRGFDPKPTEQYTKFRFSENIIPKRRLKTRIAEYLIAKGIIKSRKRSKKV